ncbi:hypothetical protein R80B4_01175 [Fibrobacteres bacterium R8-0-B4]
MTAPVAESVSAVAQEPGSKPAVAAYVAGDIPDYQKEFLGTYLLYALVNSGTDVSDENAETFLAAANEEQSKRQKALDDSLICEIARKTGIRYVLAAAVTHAPAPDSGVITLSGRVISAKTGKSRFNGEVSGSIKTMGDLAQITEAVLEKMFNGKRALLTAPPPATPPAAVPAPAANKTADSVTETTAVTADTDTADTAPVYTDTSEATVKPYWMRTKNVAVVETDIDAASGASAEITPAEVRLVTAELRREAVKNLPRSRYNVMTTETVYSQGSAVLEQCADENCVITLGSVIGADFIVRGTISKMQTKFTLTVEIYETEDGNLVGTSDPIRSENLDGLLEQAAPVCAEMYKSFVAATAPPPEPAAPPPPPAAPVVLEPDTPLWKLHKMGIDISIGTGGLIAGGFGGGMSWPDGERIKMPYTAVGAYLFFDAVYAEAFLGYASGNGQWESQNVSDAQNLPYMPRASVNAGASVKYPFPVYDRVKLFPLLGLDYEMSISGGIKNVKGGDYTFDGADGRPAANSLSSLWLKLGAGIDFDMGKTVYLRSEVIYGLRAANEFEYFSADRLQSGAWAEFGQGLAVKIGAGVRL